MLMAMKIGKNAYEILGMCIGIETVCRLSLLPRAALVTCENQIIDLRPAFDDKTIDGTEESSGVPI